HPGLLVSTSGLGDGTVPKEVGRAADFLLVHFNGTRIEDVPARIKALKGFGKPLVCNEDAKVGEAGASAAAVCVANGASWGLMAEKVNQHYPCAFRGAADDEAVYAALKALTSREAGAPVARRPAGGSGRAGWSVVMLLKAAVAAGAASSAASLRRF